ncbi:MAG: hypothetical protein H7318_15675 [Oligoflexus sp.]|nr:hypothetical protein [Oligoflexus sp.]
MTQTTKILNVQPNGQVSLGKARAGEMLQMKTLDDGRILLTPVTVQPKHHATFFTDDAKAKLDGFKTWHKEASAVRETGANEMIGQLLKSEI